MQGPGSSGTLHNITTVPKGAKTVAFQEKCQVFCCSSGNIKLFVFRCLTFVENTFFCRNAHALSVWFFGINHNGGELSNFYNCVCTVDTYWLVTDLLLLFCTQIEVVNWLCKKGVHPGYECPPSLDQVISEARSPFLSQCSLAILAMTLH